MKKVFFFFSVLLMGTFSQATAQKDSNVPKVYYPSESGGHNSGRSNKSGCCARLVPRPPSSGAAERKSAPLASEAVIFAGTKPSEIVDVMVINEAGDPTDASLWKLKKEGDNMSVDMSKLPVAIYTIQVQAGNQIEIYSSGGSTAPKLISKWVEVAERHHYCEGNIVASCDECAPGKCDVFLVNTYEHVPLEGKAYNHAPPLDKKQLVAVFTEIKKSGRKTPKKGSWKMTANNKLWNGGPPSDVAVGSYFRVVELIK